MNTKEAFLELLNSKRVPTNLRSQWSYRLERNKLSLDKIHEALLEYGYNIKVPSKWESPEDHFVRPTHESFVQLLLSKKIPSNQKKLWKNRLQNCQLSLNKVEGILEKYGYRKTQSTKWDNFVEYKEDYRIEPGDDIITLQTKEDTVWLDNNVYHCILKGPNYEDNLEKALKRERLFDQLNINGRRKPVIIDTSSLVSQTRDAQAYYSHFDRREKFAAMAIIANSAKSIYYGNFFKEINGPNIPSKIFHDYQEALEWCKEFIIIPKPEAIEFTHSKFWIHEGILHHQFHTNVQTYESILKDHEFFKSLGVAQKPQPVIVDYRSLTKMINKVRDYYLENTEIFNKYSAIAMICDHPSNDAIVQFFLEHPSISIPCKIFRQYSEALNWAKRQI